MPRALYWFRWGAAYTLDHGFAAADVVYYMGQQAFATEATWSAGAGIMILVTFLGFLIYDALWKSSLASNIRTGRYFFPPSCDYRRDVCQCGPLQLSRNLIHTGALFGTIMAFNVWFRIWPASRRLFGRQSRRRPRRSHRKMAGLRSRQNTYMSVPLFWAMIGQHTTYFAGGNLGIPNNFIGCSGS